MKFFTTILLILAMQLQAQTPCAPAHHTNPPFLVVPDTIQDWHPEEMPCFGNTICSDFSNPFAEIVNFNVSTALAGGFAIITTGHPTSDQTALTIMSRDCDTVLAQKCLDWPIDTLQFLNTTSQFSLWFECQYDTFQLTYTGWMPTGSQIQYGAARYCGDPSTATTQPIQQHHTYQKFDPMRGTTSAATTEQPQGLSLRSDGVLVLRQGVPDGLCMLAVLAFILRVSWPWMRSVLRMPATAPHPDDEDAD